MLNKEVMKKGSKLVKGAIIYGEPLEDLTIEELRVVAVLGWSAMMDMTKKTFNPFD